MSVNSFPLFLSQANQNQMGRIIGFNNQGEQICLENAAMIKRLQDMGFEEGQTFEITHVGPIGADPLAVRIEGTTIALRRAEARLIQVEMEAA